MKKLILLFILIKFTVSNAQENASISIINIEMLQQDVIGKDVQFVDLRTSKEYKQSRIDDAINISISNIEKFTIEFQKLDKNKPVYIYCYSGGRSNRASKKLAAMGFKEIYDFRGGYKAWSNR